MAKQNSITREVVSTSIQEQSKAVFNDWNLNFNVQKSGGVVKSITVNAAKGQASFNATKNEQGYVNIGFTSGTRDSALMMAVLEEMDAISATDAPVQGDNQSE